ncbi:MAG: DUF624 domain-containing protein, partial [Oscillospiraceae bacterium]
NKEHYEGAKLGVGLFFGNIEKAGSGVSKKAAPKRGFFRFFDLIRTHILKLLGTNLLYLIFSIPIITNGLAQAGTTFVTRSITRGAQSFGISDFIESVRKNFKKALPIGIINLIITVVLIADILYFLMAAPSVMKIITLIISAALFAVFSFMKYYMWFLVITFDLPVRAIYRNSLNFAVLGIKRNLLITLILGAIYGVMYFLYLGANQIGIAIDIILFICILPTLRSMIIQYNIFDTIKRYMMDPYYEKNPDSDKQLRIELGILETEAEDGDFSDQTVDDTEL